MKTTSNMKTTSKKLPKQRRWPKNCPSTATGQLILDWKYYQMSKPEMEFNMMNIVYVALRMFAHTEKTTLSLSRMAPPRL